MAISDLDLHVLQRWADQRIPAHARSQVWIELDIKPGHVTIVECRPFFLDPDSEPTRRPVARCRWTNTTKTWALFWCDSNGRFRLVPDFDTSPTIDALLDEIDANRTGAF